ncbi:MAG TPA: flagellar hook-basal body complex protein [Solirubrobacteraceae bacterium]|jgi:flagellar hook protein FlgE
MFSAVSGLKTQQVMLDVAANDLANVNTVGFKGSRTTFKDQLQQLMRTSSASGAGYGGANAAQIGLGVGLGTIDNLMSSGAVQATGNALDVAIQGDGWFRTGAGTPTPGTPTAGVPAGGVTVYTRAGNFTRNDQGYLVTSTGDYVIGRTQAAGTQDCYINIPSGATDVAIGQDGAVSFVPPAGYTQPAALPPISAGRAIAGFISLAKFPNENGLERATGNRWRAGQNAGPEVVGTPGQNGVFGQTSAGALEMSNVDLASEFTNLITAQRGFQANSRIISSADEMLQDLVNMHR